ncbi:MAG: hypothetical protein KDA96_07395 [Planctomycetaceae bacterium]|nr:hypothetical protein [Planctomycetaceae bacterium]
MTRATRTALYAASSYLPTAAAQETGLQIPFDVYLQDPLVSREDPKFGFDKDFQVPWEPGISDGPTSARFAVVDFNGDTGLTAPMAKWSNDCFVDPDGKVLDRKNADVLQFHQVNVWAILQRALRFFEEGQGLGRPIPYGFEGNRLIVVPHAGYGENAFYDRESKSLQFYYFDRDEGRVFTCLSTDIIHHEFGHAVLDGIRPYYYESSQAETAAFHEFVGDLTAILIILRNNDFRRKLAETTGGNLSHAEHLSSIAEEFGRTVVDQPYLRSAKNTLKMSDVRDCQEPHQLSQVMTGAMFDILLAISDHYISKRGETARQAFWNAIQRMQRTAIQPLDLLPPVDVTFRDYALAVLRAERISNPTDPHGYFELMLQAFVNREILTREDADEQREPAYVYDRLRLSVFHDINAISRSRAAAYRFLNDNRTDLLIPANQDVIVADLYDANKQTRQGQRLPRQVILEYLWREDVELEGAQFGKHAGAVTTMLCGGTLVFDENGNVLSWSQKPGTQSGPGERWKTSLAEGRERRERFLTNLSQRIAAGHVGAALGSSKGMLGSQIPPLTVREVDGTLRFQISPHMHLSGDHQHYHGKRRWEVSS